MFTSLYPIKESDVLLSSAALHEKLIASEVRYRHILESAKDGILILDAETGRIKEVNPYLTELLGYSQEQFIEKKIWEIGLFKDIADNQEKFYELQNKQYVRYDDLQLETATGRNIIVEFVGNLYFVDKKKVIQCNIRDITDWKQTEKAYRKSERYANALLDAIPDLMFRLNRQGVYMDYKAAKDDLAYFKDSIIGKKSSEILSSEFSALIDEKIQLTLETGKMVEFGYNLEIPTKGRHEYEARMVGIDNDDVVVIVRDVTERKNAEAVINQKNIELQKVSAEKDKFFSIIAHDLRGPFNGFLGFTQILVEELPNLTLDEMREMADDLKYSATNLYRLLENLLEWSLMQRGITKFKPQAIHLKSKIMECLVPVMELAKKKGTVLEVKVPERLTVVSDANMLSSTIRNITSNALKFTKKGGSVNILALAVSDSLVQISINDNGIGMSRQILDNLFHLDKQTNRLGTDGEPSTGLGLYLCKDFIEKNGGTLDVESEEGYGSTFRFTLPIFIK